MKYGIWKQIQTKVNDCKEAGLCRKSLNSSIVEINFGIRNFEILNELKRINEKCALIELDNIYLQKAHEQNAGAFRLKYIKTRLFKSRKEL